MKQTKINWWLLSGCITSLIISIIALSFSFFRMEPFTFGIDRYSFCIDILALLITILIGWQVVNIISFEKKMKSIVEEKASILNKEIENKFIFSEGNIYFTNGVATWGNDPLESYKCFIAAITRYLNIDKTEHYKICLENMNQLLDIIYERLLTEKHNEKLIKNDYLEKAISQLIEHDKYSIVKTEFERLEKKRASIEKLLKELTKN